MGYAITIFGVVLYSQVRCVENGYVHSGTVLADLDNVWIAVKKALQEN